MTSFDPPSWIRHLGFHYFLKKLRNKETREKLKQNQDRMLRNVENGGSKRHYSYSFHQVNCQKERSIKLRIHDGG